jgi:hypothetical protein
MKTLGFIGTGGMGSGMAADLIKVGYRLVVNDLRREQARGLEGQGAQFKDSPKAVAESCEPAWFHAHVVPRAHILCFPRGKTKFHRPDGSIGTASGHGIVLIGMGAVATAALLRSDLGFCACIVAPARP